MKCCCVFVREERGSRNRSHYLNTQTLLARQILTSTQEARTVSEPKELRGGRRRKKETQGNPAV
eukprot:maker-scaffold1179_size56971-snap-gene-0.17 protein:Tk06634 transcript:maker-scaffold1179_size56971-snap-gene-0.17-mRNA-1 annotation:"hypothetical protein MYCFIDRAFT_212986"